jgi:minor extracellular serine protease Vpr
MSGGMPTRRASIILSVSLALGLWSMPAMSQEGSLDDRAVPAHVEDLRLSTPLTAVDTTLGKLDPALIGAVGPVTVSIRLSEEAVAETGARGRGVAEQRAQQSRVEAQQSAFLGDVSGVVHGSVTKALNAVFVEVDASTLEELAADPRVERISLVVDYERDLVETVPYVGASAVHGLGFDGTGIRVAVLDSGIDYTHANLGGSGDPADYAAATADPAVVDPDLFPTAKVVGGFDFVGSVWPFGPLAPDPDPIDDGLLAGHGTHVADIIAGTNSVAPGAVVYAVKVCSSVSTSCSGIALMQAMDFALDPEGLGHVNSPVDIVNMSLGALYGQAFDDDLSQAVDNATSVGVLTVASAGNSADKPYVTGTPAAAPTALSVAQTQVPSAVLQLIDVVGVGSIPAVFQTWSVPLSEVLSGAVQYGDGAGGNRLGCDPFPAGSLTGLIVLVDRGVCNFTLKIKNIGDAGGIVGIIGLVAPGAPFVGGDGGDPITIPGFMISQGDSNAIKAKLPTTATVDPDNGLPLVGQMVGSSSRGPTMQGNIIKPEIGAPGGSVSAVAGTGTGEGPFGGTSGAAPMVSGAAALLMQAHPSRSPLEIKAVLINTGDTDIDIDPFSGLAEITRIGGGQLRVDQALATAAAAWDANAPSAALSFGFVDATKNNVTFTKTVTVRNYSNQAIVYSIANEFRFADDVANGAVRISTPNTVSVPANGSANFDVTLRIDGTKLRNWTLNSGSQGANGALLSVFEYDGYLRLTQAGNPGNSIHLPWQVLPRKSGDVSLQQIGTTYDFTDHPVHRVRNHGVGTTRVETYSLIGTSDQAPRGGAGEEMPNPNFRSVGYATFPVPAGSCSANPSFIMAFAVNTWERTTHANAPADFRFFLDVDQNGVPNYLVINRDVTLNTLSDGRNLTWVINLSTGSASAFFFTDHQTNSANTVLYFCGEQIGMNAANLGQAVDVTAQVFDLYFQGTATDMIAGITISVAGEQFLGVFDTGSGFDVGETTLSPNQSANLAVVDFGDGDSTETGLLLLYRGGGPDGKEAAVVVLKD